MPISINSNHASELTKNQLSKSIEMRKNSLEKLITGSRINSSKDDAAGVAISKNMDVKLKSLQQAQINTQLGLSYTELASNSINIMQTNVQRIRDLAERASSDIVVFSDRECMQTEVDLILSEILRTKETTEFNGIKVFGNIVTPQGIKPTNINIQVGTNSETSSVINIETGFEFNSTDVNLSTVELSRYSLDTVDEMSETLLKKDSYIASTTNCLNIVMNNLLSQVMTLSNAKSIISDADIASDAANYVKSQILISFGSNLLNVVNDNSRNTYQIVSSGIDKGGISTSNVTPSMPKTINESSAISIKSTLDIGDLTKQNSKALSTSYNKTSVSSVEKPLSLDNLKFETVSNAPKIESIGNLGNSRLNFLNSADSSKSLISSSFA